MIITRDMRLTKRGYAVVVGLVPEGGLTTQERDVFDTYGEVAVECGGRFFDKKSGLLLELPRMEAMFPSEFPKRCHFFMRGDPRANQKAILFLDTIVTRLREARDAALLAHPMAARADTFAF